MFIRTFFKVIFLKKIFKTNSALSPHMLQDNSISSAISRNNYWLYHQDRSGVERWMGVSTKGNRHTRSLLPVMPLLSINIILFPVQSTTLPSSTTVPPTSTSTPSSTTSPPANGKRKPINWMSRYAQKTSSFKILFKFWRLVKIIWTCNTRLICQLDTAF